jgi:hypothetical protein
VALAESLSRFARSSWNPLRITGTDLSPQILLMVKLVVIGLFLKNYHLRFPDVFAPFIEWLDLFPITTPWYRRIFTVVFTFSGIGLLFNRAVRKNCLIIGALILIGVLSSKVHYRNAKVFAGVLFFLAGLQERGRSPTLIWWQLAIMYFGAGLNKLLEPDWRSGQYFAYFLTELRPSDIYALFAPMLPGIWTAKLMCWFIIAAELGAGVLFVSRRFRPAAVCLGTSVHAGAAILVTGDYGIYLTAVLASYLSCLAWPEKMELAVDEGSRWRPVKAWAERLDGDRLIEWRTPESAGGTGFTLSAFGRSGSGWAAFGCLLVWTPAVYFVAVVIMTGFKGLALMAIIRAAGIVAMMIVIGATFVKLRALLARSAHARA